MRIALNQGAGAKSAARMHLRTAAGTKEVVRAWIRDTAGIKQFFASLAVNLSTYTAMGRGNSATVINVTSEPVTATVVGASSSVAHAWTRTAPDAQPWTIDDPTSATTTFSTVCDQGDSFTATFIDTVTDNVTGQVKASNPVTADCANIYYGGGYPGRPGSPGQPFP